MERNAELFCLLLYTDIITTTLVSLLYTSQYMVHFL